VTAATIAALLTGGIGAYASIPDQTQGKISSCYDKTTGVLRVVDTPSYYDPSCNANETGLQWNQQGRQGPTGMRGVPGPQGQQGPPGPNTVHWAKVDATGHLLGSSEPLSYFWGMGGYGLIGFANVNVEKCAITVTPRDADSATNWQAGVSSTYSYYQGLIYYRAIRQSTGNGINIQQTGMDVVASC
jgi:hypothetical protein